MSKKGYGKMLFGLGLGVGLGALFSPKSGEENRKELKEQLDKFVEKLKEIDINEVKDEFLNKVEDLRIELEGLDKEKAGKLAKEKGKEIKKKADELVELAKEKGTPVIEEASKKIKKQAAIVTKKVLDKLEETK